MSSFCRYLAAICGVTLFGALVAARVSATEALHVRIDRQIAAAQIGPASPIVSDAEFLRRVSLDLTGQIPAAATARQFLADTSTDKRPQLVDRLLASPQFEHHMANVFDVMFMERRADKGVPSAEWRQYLRRSIAENKPYDQLAREILAADGVDPALRPAVKFYLDREGEPNLLARDVGRIFFGRDLQCAQCHDHPNIDSYYQADYYGLFACFNRGVLFTDPKDKKIYFAEKADGGVAFHSVFDPDAKGHTRPRLPGGLQLGEPAFEPGEEYTVKPADGVRPVPKYSRRARLSAEATSGTNRAFNENIANRLWAHLFGRGLVEPVDLHHADNPPSHPKLLTLVADEFVAMKYDVKAFLREVVLSQTYQRAIDLPEQVLLVIDPSLPAHITSLETELQRLSAAATDSVKAVEQAQDELRVTRTAAVDLASQAGKMAAAAEEAKKAANTALQARDQAQSALNARQEAANALGEAAAETERAAQQLPEDKPLAAAAAKFKERALPLAAEVAAAAKAVADLAASANSASQKLAAAQSALAELIAKRTAADTRVESFEAQHATALVKNQADRAAARHTQRRLSTLQSLLSCQAAIQARNASRTAIAKLDAEQRDLKLALAKIAADLPGQQQALADGQQQHAAAAEALAQLRRQLAVRGELAKTVARAASKADVARQKLPADAELAQAAQTIKDRAEQLAAESAELTKSVAAGEQAMNVAAAGLAVRQQAVDSAMSALGNCESRIATLSIERQTATAKLHEDDANHSRLAEELTRYEIQQFATASLKPLAPEQLAWSVMQAIGLSEQLCTAAEAELNAKAPLTDAIRNDPAQLALRAMQIDDAAHAKLQANAARFVELFGAGAGQPQTYFATADQALFFGNDGQIRNWLAPAAGNLTERLSQLSDPTALAEELYLSVLTRLPNEAEIAETTTYLTARADQRTAAVQELAWALIASIEFRFNH